MKKKLLTALGSIVIIGAPIASVVSCGSLTKNNDNEETPKASPTTGSTKHHGNSDAPATHRITATSSPTTGSVNHYSPSSTPAAQRPPTLSPSGEVSQSPQEPEPVTTDRSKGEYERNFNFQEDASAYDAERTKLINFEVSEVTENPNIGYLGDVNDTPRLFKVYDNGLFKIKIEKALIGNDQMYLDEGQALKQARIIANSINIGPAIFHLEKGIQILKSNSEASLGGDKGVQVAINWSQFNGPSTLENMYSVASLVAHEYGHHETLWDFHAFSTYYIEDVQEIMNIEQKILNENNLKAVADKINITTDGQAVYVNADPSDLPTGYSQWQSVENIKAIQDYHYPFNSMEIATRVLNELSFTTEGMSNPFLIDYYHASQNEVRAVTTPAFLDSYLTMKHHAHTGVFGPSGKDNTKTQELFQRWLKELMGYTRSYIGLIVDENNYSHLRGIELDSFGINIDKLEIINPIDNSILKTIQAKTANGLFGYKDELLAKTQAHKMVIPISSIDDSSLDIPNSTEYIIKAFDKNGNEVDLSNIHFNHARIFGKANESLSTETFLRHEGNHLNISASGLWLPFGSTQ